jgi:hypothetical protein
MGFPPTDATQHTDCDSRNQNTAWKGFPAARNKAAVWGVSGV